jgi:hypothetical protein
MAPDCVARRAAEPVLTLAVHPPKAPRHARTAAAARTIAAWLPVLLQAARQAAAVVRDGC